MSFTHNIPMPVLRGRVLRNLAWHPYKPRLYKTPDGWTWDLANMPASSIRMGLEEWRAMEASNWCFRINRGIK